MRKGKVVVSKSSQYRNKSNDYFNVNTSNGKVKDVTEDYKKSLLTKKPVEVKSRFPNTDTKVWEPQPKQVYIGRGAKGVKIYQYVSARGNNDNV
tara:strand:- start:16 stop:297 length:282 start_codon:yes stop_codon:yes gene_type:complete